MKKFISLMCIVLTFATLLCACNGGDGDVLDTLPETSEIQTAPTTTAGGESTTATPAPAVKKTYVNFDGEVSATATEINALKIRAFTGEGGRYQHAQGGCIMGDYLITCMHSPTTDKVCVVKSDLKTGNIVAKKENMSLGHGNDAAYNPDDNVIVVADCGTNGHNWVHILDADTLELKQSRQLNGSGTTICSIAYDEVNKRYIGIGVQNDKLHIYNRHFQLLKEIDGYGMSIGETGAKNLKGEYSMQGILTDGTYLYILEWHGGKLWAERNATDERQVQSHILVTELSTGKHVATIDTGIKRELEFAGYRNGRLYIACNNIHWTGMEFYRVDITTAKQ